MKIVFTLITALTPVTIARSNGVSPSLFLDSTSRTCSVKNPFVCCIRKPITWNDKVGMEDDVSDCFWCLLEAIMRNSGAEAYLRAVCQTCIMHGIIALEIWAHQIDLLVCGHRPQQHHYREISLVGSLVDVNVMIVQCGRCVYNAWICRSLLSNWLFWACCECTCLTDLACLAWPHHTSAFVRIYRCCISCGYSTLQGCCRCMVMNGVWLP